MKTVFLGVHIFFFTGNPNTWFPETKPPTQRSDLCVRIIGCSFKCTRKSSSNLLVDLTDLT